jgi:hypothetical protein
VTGKAEDQEVWSIMRKSVNFLDMACTTTKHFQRHKISGVLLFIYSRAAALQQAIVIQAPAALATQVKSQQQLPNETSQASHPSPPRLT